VGKVADEDDHPSASDVTSDSGKIDASSVFARLSGSDDDVSDVDDATLPSGPSAPGPSDAATLAPSGGGEASASAASSDHAERAEAAERSRRAPPGGWPRLPIGDAGSYIRLSTNKDGSKDMRAICALCKKTMSKTCKPSDYTDQGRPLGFLAAWLLRDRHHGADADQHGLDLPNFAARCAARERLRPSPLAVAWFAAERKVDAKWDDPTIGEPRG
jgi:hypothetical protein